MKEKDNTVEEMKIPDTPFRYFWFVSKPFKGLMTGAVLIVVIAAAAEQSLNYFLKLIIDAIERGDQESAAVYALLFPCATLAMQLLYRLSGFVGSKWVTEAKKRCYDSLTMYTLGHSHQYFIDRFAGSLMSKVRNVTGAIESLIPDLLWTHTTSITALVVTMGFLFTIDVRAALVFITLIFTLIIVNRLLAKKQMVHSRASADAVTTITGRIVDIFSNIQAVRQYAHQAAEITEIDALSREVRDTSRRSWLYSEKLLFINVLILFAFTALMFSLVVSGWKAGTISTGQVIFTLGLYAHITFTLLFIGRAFNSTARELGEMREGLEELIVPYEIVDAPHAPALTVQKADIEWKGVDFSFAGITVFKDFALHIPAGQRVGLVGHSGAGKTTFVSLMLRQHELGAGSIMIDGQDIASVTQDSLRKNIAVVPQEPALFHRSIRENIAYGKPDATKEEIEQVAREARAHDFIKMLPEGYDTLVGERGVKLSGGQKQRVAIARAMLKDAPILILDEATSALDSESEVAIQKALHELMEGKTVIAVAHRLSTLREMDRIIVLEEGKIIEDGSHEELVSRGGIYARLWDHQAGGFLQD